MATSKANDKTNKNDENEKKVPEAQHGVLEPTESIIEVMSTPLYLKGVLTNIVFTFAANFFITKMINDSKPQNWVYFGDETISNTVFFFVLVPSLLTILRSEIHKAILAGHVRPLSSYTLAANPMTSKGLMYACSIPNGWIRLLPFIFNAGLFPGIAVVGILMSLCQRNSVKDDLTGIKSCPMPLYGFVALDAVWKTISVVIIYTMHFIACHNEREPEILPHLPAIKTDAEKEIDSNTAENPKTK